MDFQPDQRFDSLTDAFAFTLGQYALRSNDTRWGQTDSGVIYPRELPHFLFRGECGNFPTTTDSARRLEVEAMKDEFPLSPIDLIKLGKLIHDLAVKLSERLDELSRLNALALLQHYGLPTRIVDFTGNPAFAFAFAASGTSSVGRVAVMPRESSSTVSVVDLMAHPWAERAQRQGGFGVVMANGLTDLKSDQARSHLNIRWYEFPITSSDRDFFREVHDQLMEPRNDPSAGFLRFHITEYVEAFGKLSPALTDWLLNKVVIAPYCFQVGAFEDSEVVVYHRAAANLAGFDERTEIECSRRYWSIAAADDSFERMKNFSWPNAGTIVADPRTYHPHLYGA
jgi:hypothetical protein